jgi:hypothetical protein
MTEPNTINDAAPSNDVALDDPSTPWSESNAKKHLKKEIVDGKITGKKPKEVYLMNQAYQVYKYENFCANFARLKKSIKRFQDCAAWEHDAMVSDRSKYPFPQVMHQGFPVWHRSEAERHLKNDVLLGLHKVMTPRELFNTRVEYIVFIFEVFRKHILQEKRTITDNAYWRWLEDKKKK